jgi:hypothetical protein
MTLIPIGVFLEGNGDRDDQLSTRVATPTQLQVSLQALEPVADSAKSKAARLGLPVGE